MLEGSLFVGGAAGLLSTALMVASETPFWFRQGIDGVVEWRVNQILVSAVLGERHDPKRRLGEALGMHLFHGAVGGAFLAALLSVLLPSSRGVYWLAALLFSLLLWTLVPLFRGRLETTGGAALTDRGLAISLFVHVVYGLSLGLLLQAWL